MKTGIIIAIIVYLSNLGYASQNTFSYLKNDKIKQYSKQEANKKLKELYKKSDHHCEAIKEFISLGKNATHNISTIVYIAELSYKIGYHTKLFLSLGQIAANAKHEIQFLDEIAELISMDK